MQLNPTQLKDLICLLDYAAAVTQRQHEDLWHSRALMYRMLFENELAGTPQQGPMPILCPGSLAPGSYYPGG
jgi:hypothetical protein